jgi:predicted MFS family arabinose efflux permease
LRQLRVVARGAKLKRVASGARSPWAARLGLPSNDLLLDAVYRRLWLSILISSVGGQVTLLALPLTAALLLHATPTQMGVLTAIESLPFVLFSLPVGVWLDRVPKLPVYIAGELAIAFAVASVPLVWWLGALSMAWLYAVGFVLGCVSTTAGSAAQIVLTQVVPRERLVEAHARNALANSSAEVAGPGAAGLLIRLAGPPVALLLDALMVLASAAILRGIQVDERCTPKDDARFWRDLVEGLRFVRHQRLLLAMALTVGCWQLCQHAAQVVVILHATRSLGLGEQAIGLCYAGLGLGTLAASMLGHRVSHRFGPGPSLLIGFAASGLGWLLPALLPAGPWGVVAFAAMLVLGGIGGVLMFINFLALRQAVTPAPLLGRMTTTMRWLILLPAAPGALLGGVIGERLGLTAALGAAGGLALLMVALAWRLLALHQVRVLPAPGAGSAA